MAKTNFITTEEAEALFDITLVAGDLIRRGALRDDIDSRELFRSCLHYAAAFHTYAPLIDHDYLTLIDEFATRRLMTDYGKED